MNAADERAAVPATGSDEAGGPADGVATGYVAYSGDAVTMGRTIRALAEKGVAIGAQVRYPDGLALGQESFYLDDVALCDVFLAQVATIAALAESAGSKLAAVRCHDALAMDVSSDERTAQVVARTLYRLFPGVSLVCVAASPGGRVARDCGVSVVPY